MALSPGGAGALTTLEGRVIALAGAGGNLGPTVVGRLAPTGALLELAGRETAALDELADRVGGEVATTGVDLLDQEAARAWAHGIVERNGRVDALVHMIGGWRGGKPLEDAPLDDWDALEPLLVRTLMHTTQAFLPRLLESARGRVVVISAGQAQSPTHTNAVYAAAKGASETWALAVADRCRGTGCTANIIVVGSIVTPDMRREDPEKDFSKGTPAEEIAEAIAYLCSDAAASMNGQRLTLRGAA